MTETFLTRREAADYIRERGLRCAPSTLQKYATVGGGPRYRRFGMRAVYVESDLDEWIERRLTPPMESTSGVGMAAGRGA